MNWKELLVSEIKSNYTIAEGLLEMVDDNSLDWKPSTGENWMKIGQLLHHLADSCGSGMRGFVTGDWGMLDGVDLSDLSPEDMHPSAEKLPATGSIEEAKSQLAKDKALALDMLAQCDENRLANEKMGAPWNPAEKILGYHLLVMTNHLGKHSSQLFYYLKLQGKPVHTGHLWA